MRDYRGADAELIRQLDEAKGSDTSVAAAISVRRARGVAPDVTKIDEDVRSAVARAGQASHSELDSIRVMPHLAVAYVSGPEQMIRELLRQPEIIGAVAGRRPADPDPEVADA
jgi:hypothetical protein